MVYHQFFGYRQFLTEKVIFLWGVLVEVILYDTPNIKSRAALHPICAFSFLIPCTGIVVCAITIRLPSGGIASNLYCISYLHFIRGVVLFVPALDNPDQVSDRARSIQAVSVWMVSLWGVRNPFGGGRNHQQRPGIYVTLTSVAMAQRLACRVAVQEEMPDMEETHPQKFPGNPGKRRNHLLT